MHTTRITTAAFAVSAVLAACAEGPRVLDSGISMTQDEATRRVTVTYSLSEEPGIVTFAVQTNAGGSAWVPIGGEAVSRVYGDVNKVVTNTATPSSFVWIPDDTWPDRVIADGTLRGVVTVWPTNDPPDYAVVEPRLAGGVSYYADAGSVPGGVTNDIYRRGKFLMRRIHATGARFTMGSPIDEPGRDGKTYRETPHRVTFTNDYYMGVFEVSQDQWRTVTTTWNAYFCFTNLSYSGSLPMTGVDYDEIRGGGVGGNWSSANSLTVAHGVHSSSFLGKLRAQTGIDFDLPTEAEWEFACRAGTTTMNYGGPYQTEAALDEIAWYAGNSVSEDSAIAEWQDNDARSSGAVPRPGGLKKPNAWGLYDMLGNVYEWCLDASCYDLGYEAAISPMGAPAPESGSARMTRGGSYLSGIDVVRSAKRFWNTNSSHKSWNGFRLSCPCPVTKKW